MELRQLKLYSKDISKQFDFYKNTLGFEVDYYGKNKIELHAGSTHLIFEEKKESNFIYHFAFLIPNQKLEEVIIFLEKKGIELLKKKGEKIIHFGTKENYTGRAIYFFDKDKNIAEFIERPSLGFENHEPFSLHQIIKINEIGIPVDEPISFSKNLISEFNISLINPNLLTESFCWAGDFNGVFIVVKNGRHWLPTQLEAKSNDCSVKFESGGKIFEKTF